MKKIWILVSLIMILFTTYEVAETYAKYVSETTATVDKQAGAWVIKINNIDLTSSTGEVKNFSINSLSYNSGDYVLANKFAPSASGYFDIVLDPTGASVAIRYDLTIDFSELSDISSEMSFDFACKVVNGVEDRNALMRTAANTYTGTISLDDVKNEVSTTARFYIKWEDDGTGTNDQADSALGVSGGTLSIPVSVVVSQYSGETITAYQ